MTALPEPRPFINGAYVDTAGEATFDTVNPATEEVICTLQEAGTAEVDAAVAAAREAFKDWSRRTGAERAKVLMRAAAIMRERNDELAALEVMDVGKPIQEAEVVDVASGYDSLEFFAGVAPTLHGQHLELGGNFAYTRREPLGVCAGIGAWNYPLQISCWKSAPALACGNTMVFKPSELSPLTALKMAEIYHEAGLPPGAFNVLPGGRDLGAALSSHPGIAKVTFTGSVPTGKKIMAAGAETLKHVTLELGGKSPLIVFADADLDNAVSAAMLANFYTQGEVCSNGTRVFVEKPILEPFIEKCAARVRALKIGDPTDPETQVGALISADHRAKVLGYIEKGRAAGARLVCGGGVPAEPNRGYFVEPTIFADCTDDMDIVRDEIFGPVMSVLSFDTEDEAIRRANDTDFGLAAGVCTSDLARGHRVVARLEAGTCWINTFNICPVEVPFGGYKNSGFGRENSVAAIEHFTQLKSVYVETGDVDSPY